MSAVCGRIGRVSEESGATGAGELGPYAEKVLDAVDLIPPGRVMTYGDVAEWLGKAGRVRSAG